jgi:hypothetical protein
VWCGVVWCGVVWCGVVWCGVVWCGVVWWARPDVLKGYAVCFSRMVELETEKSISFETSGEELHYMV